MSYFRRLRRAFDDRPSIYVAKCACRQILFVPLPDRMLNSHPAPWYFERIYGWRIEDGRISCPRCLAREAIGWKTTS